MWLLRARASADPSPTCPARAAPRRSSWYRLTCAAADSALSEARCARILLRALQQSSSVRKPHDIFCMHPSPCATSLRRRNDAVWNGASSCEVTVRCRRIEVSSATARDASRTTRCGARDRRRVARGDDNVVAVARAFVLGFCPRGAHVPVREDPRLAWRRSRFPLRCIGARTPAVRQAVSNIALLRTNADHRCSDRGAFTVASGTGVNAPLTSVWRFAAERRR